MLRHAASALLCALSTIAFVTTLSSLVSDPPASASAPARAPVGPESHSRVRGVATGGLSELFVTVSTRPAFRMETGPLPPFNPGPLRPAFDPDLYRSGKVGEPLSTDEICDVVVDVASEFELPIPLFTRLIWQESRFRNETVSRKGAQGLAQFMPETAAERGLDDPFDPLQALPASADFLRELTNRFGNFGLAAAAYNSGPQRVQNWLAGRARLPRETRNYVLNITGRKAEHWAKKVGAEPHPDAFKVKNCAVRPITAAVETRRR